LQIFTVGHSTRTVTDFLKILTSYHVTALADVRRYPVSSKNPQFNKKVIDQELSGNGIRYVWLNGLGGRRKGLGSASKNTCWRNTSFRSYADYMETTDFLDAMQELLQLAVHETVAIMCAETVYWKCHRYMIADFLKSEGVEVTHILDGSHSKTHSYTECARLVRGRLTYHQV
jgi:uncharacterized protein (DUF488 family)